MRARVESPELVGRQEELERLAVAVDRSRRGEATVVLVAGEAGVGKTRLVDEATGRAASAGARVLSGRCVELGGEGLAFVPIVDALRQLVRTTAPDELDSLLGYGRRELARLLPELGPDAGDALTESGAATRLFECVLGLVGRLAAQQPLILVVEDLHWADRSTLDLLSFLLRTLRVEPVLVIATYRAEDVGRRHPLRQLLGEFERLPNVERIELSRFGRSEVIQQVRGILGSLPSGSVVDDVLQRSQGNAFFVEELVAALESGDQLPTALLDVLLARVDGLSQPARGVLQAASAAGQRVGHRLLAAVVGLGAGELDAALREAVEHHVLEVEVESGAGRYAFRHALMREAVYDDLLPGERVRFHLAYGEALERDPGLAEGNALAALLAHHWYAARDMGRALTASIQAGADAAAAYAFAEAIAFLERAIEVWPSVDRAEERTGIDLALLLERTADATAATGDIHRATALVDEALRLVDAEREPVRTALLLARRGRPGLYFGPDAVDDLRRAVELLPPGTPGRASVLGSRAAAALILEGDYVASASVAAEAAEAAQAEGDSRQFADALITLGSAQAYTASSEVGVAVLRRALEAALDTGHDDTALRAYINLTESLRASGRLAEAAETGRRASAFAEQIGSKISGIIATANLAEVLLQWGDWDEAEAVLADAMTYVPPGALGEMVHSLYAELMVGRGDIDAARGHLAHRGDERNIQISAQRTTILAMIDLAEGRLDDARARLRKALVDSTVDNAYTWPHAWLLARVETEIGLIAAAPTAASDDMLPAQRGYLLMAEAERLRPDGAGGVPAWTSTVNAWRIAEEAPRLAYALYRLAEASVAAGDRPSASAALAEAFGIAERLRATPLLDDIRSLAVRGRVEITAAGGVAGKQQSASEWGLTSRELEVLRLVAAGQSNGNIAAQLFISPKTVSVHVSNIIAKFGVRGRGEAAALAHKRGLIDG